MRFTGMSTEAADILGDVVGTDEYDAVPETTEPVEDGSFVDAGATATEDGNESSGETSENIIEDQADLDLTNKQGGEYDAVEDPAVVAAEDGDGVDVVDNAFDAAAAADDGTDGTDDVIGGADDEVTGDTDDGTGFDTDGDGEITDDGTDGTDGADASAEVPDEAAPEATDVPVEATDTDDQAGLTDDQVEVGAASVESFFTAIDRRAVRSFEDGEESILDETEVADAEVPVAEDIGAVDDSAAVVPAVDDGVADDGTAGTEEVVVPAATDDTTVVDDSIDTPANDDTSVESIFSLF